MIISCHWCGRRIRRSRRYAETHLCFCSRRCHTLFLNMCRAAQMDADEKDRISRELFEENDKLKERYGAV